MALRLQLGTDMSRWYRAYAGTVKDDKLAEVSVIAECSRSVGIAVWHAILESAAETDDGGRFETTPRRVAAALCEPASAIEAVFMAMEEIGMIGAGAVSAWKARQYESDKSTERSRKHRETKRNGDATLQGRCATPPETEADTERKQEPVASATGCDDAAPKPALSLVDQLWTDGIVTLETMRVVGPKARSMVGKWLKDTGSDAGRVLWAINEAQVHGSGDPIPYISRVLSDRSTGQRAPPRQAPYQTRRSFGEIARESAAKLAGYRDEPDRQADEYSGPTLDLVAGGAGPDIVDLHSRRSGGF
jgi:hypothetical protein